MKSFQKNLLLTLVLLFGSNFSSFGQNNLIQLSRELSKAFHTNDTLYSRPYIDVDEWRDIPVRHRYIHGGFDGTENRFSFYLPVPEKYQGRFFQYITPFPDNEFLSQGLKGEDDKIGFSIISGAYFIETNSGGKIDFAKPMSNQDPTIGAFRANAASASFSKIVANKIYGPHRTYGYAFGGSGGAYRTIGSIENTEGVWDGVVPYVLGSPMAIPNVFSVRMHAMRILNDKFSQIIDALDAGGNGNMYEGLNEEEKDALKEVTQMGFPPQSWFGYKTMGIHGFIALYQGMKMADRNYFEEFWKVNGYLGATPPESLLKARLQKVSKIKASINIDEAVRLGLKEPLTEGEKGSADLAWKSLGGIEGAMPVAYELEDNLPDVHFLGGDLLVKSGNAVGKTIQIASISGNKIVLGPVDPSVLAQINIGDEVFVDNANFLAVQTYHRHQVPGKEYKVWDLFRDDTGKPIYPQRPMLLGPIFTSAAAGVLPTGIFKGKMILLCSLWDREAFPWQGDFYRNKVKAHLGNQADEHFRIWYTDHALHGDISKQEHPTRTVSYLGTLQQALRDLSAWCEKGTPPPASTNYSIEDGQVITPANAHERKGIQPLVKLSVQGNKLKVIKKGQTVTFTATVDIPENTGKLVSAEWDFDGKGHFPLHSEKSKVIPENRPISISMKYKFTDKGIYYPTLRVASQREGDDLTPYTRIQNLDRVKVIVE